jgi:hypothetical protein
MLDLLELGAPQVPGISLVSHPVRRLVCGGDEYALLWNDQLTGAAAATLAERQAIPAVLVAYNNEAGAYVPAYYFFADPAGHGRYRVVGVRGSGRTGLVGSGEVSAGQIGFELTATETPLEHPLTAAGSYNIDTGTVRFDVAVVERRFNERQQRLRIQPRPVARPR